MHQSTTIEYTPIPEALEAIRNGEIIIMVADSEEVDRGKLGTVCVAAQYATPAKINRMLSDGRGMLALALTEQRAQELKLDLSPNRGGANHGAFTTSIEAKKGVSTGISAADRAYTISTAINTANPDADLVSPGHIFPIIAKDGGVLARAGHAEAAVDMAKLADLNASGVVCGIMDDAGNMGSLEAILDLRNRLDLKIISILDLLAFRREFDATMRCISESDFKSEHGGEWKLRVYRSKINDLELMALQKMGGEQQKRPLVYVHGLQPEDDLFARLSKSEHALHETMEDVAQYGVGVIFVSYILSAKEGATTELSSTDNPPHHRAFLGVYQICSMLGLDDIISLVVDEKSAPNFTANGFKADTCLLRDFDPEGCYDAG